MIWYKKNRVQIIFGSKSKKKIGKTNVGPQKLRQKKIGFKQLFGGTAPTNSTLFGGTPYLIQ